MPQGKSIPALRISKHAARMVKACTTDRNPCGTLWLPPRPKKGGRISLEEVATPQDGGWAWSGDLKYYAGIKL